MERIEAIIRTERLNLVKDALAEAGLAGLLALGYQDKVSRR